MTSVDARIVEGFRLAGCNDGEDAQPAGPSNPLDTLYWSYGLYPNREDWAPRRAPQDTAAIREWLKGER